MEASEPNGVGEKDGVTETTEHIRTGPCPMADPEQLVTGEKENVMHIKSSSRIDEIEEPQVETIPCAAAIRQEHSPTDREETRVPLELAEECEQENDRSFIPNIGGRVTTSMKCEGRSAKCSHDGTKTEQYDIDGEDTNTGTSDTVTPDHCSTTSLVNEESVHGTKMGLKVSFVREEIIEQPQVQTISCNKAIGQEPASLPIGETRVPLEHQKTCEEWGDGRHSSSSETDSQVNGELSYHGVEKARTSEEQHAHVLRSNESNRSEGLRRKSAGLRLDLTGDVQVKRNVNEIEGQLLETGNVVDNIRGWLLALQRMEVFSTPGALEILKAIANSHWQHPESREEIASAVSTSGGAEILQKILVSLGKEGLFKKNAVWYPANYCYNIVWNLSDGSSELAASLANSGMVSLCAANIAHKPYLDNMHKKNVLFLLKASLSILHNISRVQSVKHKFREVDLIQKLMPYTSTDQKYLKALCMLILANIVDEDQETLLDEKGTVEFLIQLLKEAQASDDRRAQGLSCAELANGLGRLAVNDANKGKIQAANGLPPFINMLESEDLAEQEAATQALWSLSFDPSICKLLSTNQKALDSLKALRSCGSQAVEVSAKGTLWMLRQHRKSTEDGGVDGKKNIRPKSSRQSSLRKIHVMISYQWSSQKKVLRIRDDLVAAGYIVWVDVDKMCGSTLQAMAEAVERAAAVIICMSESYKISPNCRTEAEYAYQLQKWIIPLMMDMYYEPDGWLGLILGAKYYMDFSGAVPYEESSQRLIRELDGSKSSFDAPDSVFDEVEAVITKSTAVTCDSAVGPMNWTEEQVQSWLSDHNLERYNDAFKGCNGKLLLQLRALRLEAPEFFYRSLREDLAITGIFNILKFTDALEDVR